MRGSLAVRGALPLVLLGLLAAPAGAAETIGEVSPQQFCGSNQAVVQRSTGAGKPRLDATTSGVIVSWSYQTVNNPPSIRLRVYRATDNPAGWFARSETSAKVVGGGPDQVKANTVNTFTQKPGIPILAGDRLGITASGGDGISCVENQTPQDLIRVSASAPPVGTSNTSFAGELPNLRLAVRAVIEPDADGDKFGDETQDACPTEPTVQTAPCPDRDGDGFTDSVDPCPDDSDTSFARNPRTGCPTDNDGDGNFDTADPDDDNDGVLDAQDSFPSDASRYLPDPTAGNDTINGIARDDTICGLAGNDTLNGNAGNDTLWGDACLDRTKRLFGAQTGTDGNDTLNGGDGNDSLFGAGGKDKLRGGAGKDKLAGGDGNDSLDGGTGKDSLDGGRGNDKLVGGKDTNKYKAGAGNDTVSARNGKKETVDCGSGSKDKATVDRTDVVKGCESVARPR